MKKNALLYITTLIACLGAVTQTHAQYFNCIKIDHEDHQKACFYEKEKMCVKMEDMTEKMRCEEQIARKHDICNHQETLDAIAAANDFAKTCVAPTDVDNPNWTQKVARFFESPNQYRQVFDAYKGCPNVSQMDNKLCNEAPSKFKEVWNKRVDEYLEDSRSYYEPKIQKLKDDEFAAMKIAKKQMGRAKEILDLMDKVGTTLGDGKRKAVEGSLKGAKSILEKIRLASIAKYKSRACPDIENKSARLAKKMKAQGQQAATVFGENGKTKVLKVNSEYKEGRDYNESKDFRDYNAVICVEAQGEMKEILEEKEYPTCYSQEIVIRHLNDMYVEKWGNEYKVIAPNPLETLGTKTLPMSCKKMK